MAFEDINLTAVFVAAVLKFILGVLWFSPVVFGSMWLSEVGQEKDQLIAARGPLMLSGLLGLVSAFTLAVLITLADLGGVQSLAVGCLIGLGIMTTQLGALHGFEGRSFRLLAIYGGQYIIEFSAMAAIIGFWR
ncbi:DUF1761 domain-containing protein [Paremcibacter congregatus]|uniref:DUF1761 domain-containing protein n=1 Tax=Paremcibacter congregatus TaxID=2043170 RepID=UPI003A933129